MKTIIDRLKEDWQVFIFALIGLVLLIFPAHVAGAAPYLIGVTSLIYAIVNIIISLKYPDAQTHLGDAVARGVTGCVILFLKGNSIPVLGVIWAVLSLNDIARKIDDAYKTKHLSPLNAIGIIISLILAAMLMTDPFEHFNMHVRILGLEMITNAFIRRIKRVKNPDR